MRGSSLEGGGGGSGPPSLEIAMLNIADITGNDEKISYFSYLCTSTVTRQTESIHKTSIHVCNGFFLT